MPESLDVVSFRLDRNLIARLREVEACDGIRMAEQLRRAVRAWLDPASPRRGPRSAPETKGRVR